jgi:hypothetical protein
MNIKSEFNLAPLKLQIKTTYFLIVAMFFILSSCKEQLTNPQYYPEPIEYRYSTFPLFTNNQWVYVDTNFSLDQSVFRADIYLSSINYYTGESNHGKWRFTTTDGVYNSSYVLYSISNDTIFIEDTWNNSQLLNPRIAFLPSSSIHDTVTIQGPYPSTITKVYALNHSFATPAGIFDSVYVYSINVPDSNYIYFRPGIGVIYEETIFNKKPTYKRVLTSYKLVE